MPNRVLEGLLEPLPFDLWRITFSEYGEMLARLQGMEPLASDIDIAAMLAPPPT